MGVAALSAALSILFIPAANASGGISMALKIKAADKVGSCSNGQQLYDITADLIANTTDQQDVTVATRRFMVDLSSNLAESTDAAEIINDGGFSPGLTLHWDQNNSFTGIQLRATVPCDATYAAIHPEAMLEGSNDVFRGGQDQFVPSVLQVPVAALGILGLALLLGVALFVIQRRKKGSLQAARAAG